MEALKQYDTVLDLEFNNKGYCRNDHIHDNNKKNVRRIKESVFSRQQARSLSIAEKFYFTFAISNVSKCLL